MQQGFWLMTPCFYKGFFIVICNIFDYLDTYTLIMAN